MNEGKRAERSIVVGAGVIGLSTAYYLARRGIDVLVLERKEVGAGASSGNAGAVPLADWIVEGSPPEPGLMSLRPDRV